MFGPGRTQLIIIICYLLLLLGVGFVASRMFRGTRKDYQLASHSIGPIFLLLSMFGTTMTAFALVGSSGEAFKKGIGVYGMLASASGIVHSLCFFIIGVRLWKLGRKNGYTTQIEFFRDRLQSDSIGLLLFPILVGLIIPYLLIGVMASGSAIQAMTAGAFPSIEAFKTDSPGTSYGVPPYLGSLLICLVVLVYVFFGGMRGTTWANGFQTIVFMVLGLVTFYIIADKLGNQGSFIENLRVIAEKIPEDKATRSGMSHSLFITYMLIPLSVAMFPHLFQHWLTAKSAKSFKLPVVMHPIFVMIVWVPCVLLGVWATTGLTKIPESIHQHQNNVLPYLVNHLTSPVLSGFLAAGILAAIMSSLDSQFLCVGTIFNNDIVNHYAGNDRKISDRNQVLLTRSFIVIIVGLTYFLSLQGYRSVFSMAVWCFTGYSSLFPLVFLALYWRRLTKAGAICGIVAAIGSWGYFFWDSNYGAEKDYALKLTFGETEMELMAVLATFLISLIVTVGVSLVTRAPSDDVLERFFGKKEAKSGDNG